MEPYQWVLKLPEDLLVVDGDYVIFQFGGKEQTELEEAIDRLLIEFTEFEKKHEGKN